MNNRIYEPHKSTIANLDANLVALLVYIISAVAGFIPVVKYVAWLAPLVVFFIEKNSRLVKFHSMQAFLINVVSSIISIIIAIISAAVAAAALVSGADPYGAVLGAGLSAVIGMVLQIGLVVVAVLAMISAWRYEEKSMPIVGALTLKIIGKN